MDIAFIGVGVMGGPMIKNLLKNGFDVTVYNRTREKAAEVLAAGARWANSVAECVRNADAVITIIGYPKDVEEVYFDPSGILENAKKGATVVDMTTSSPELARRIYARAAELGLRALDAPVTGGNTGAQKGTLTIMVGGDKTAFENMRSVFDAMGENIRYAGGAGFGQHTKAANQIAIAGAMAGVCEALAYARAVGLDLQELFDAISAGSAASWQMTINAPKIIRGDYSPAFYMKHYIKDLGIAESEAKANGASLAILETVLARYRALAEQGLEDEGIQAYIKGYAGEW